ncbi:nitrilase-related carbon-nitrogen hydrolase, partial [uncultured Halovibrio sp.]
MTASVSVAAIQMVSGFEVEQNLVRARELLEQAAEDGARVAVLPENFAAFQNRRLAELGQSEARGEDG